MFSHDFPIVFCDFPLKILKHFPDPPALLHAASQVAEGAPFADATRGAHHDSAAWTRGDIWKTEESWLKVWSIIFSYG